MSNAKAGTIKIIKYWGIGAVSTLANLSYAGMRAQGETDKEDARKYAFILGFPYSIVTYLAVDLGSNTAYGVKL